MNTINKSILVGQRLKRCRQSMNETQSAFAERIGCGQTTLSKYETEGINTLDEIVRIGNILGINLLLDDEAELQKCSKLLKKIYNFYTSDKNKKIGETFLTKKNLKDNLLGGYDITALDYTLSVLVNKDYIKIYESDDKNNKVCFILVKAKAILQLDDDDLFPKALSGDVVSLDLIQKEFNKYKDGKLVCEDSSDFNSILKETENNKVESHELSVQKTKKICDKYRNKNEAGQNLILSKNVSIGLDLPLNQNNKNVLISHNHNQKDAIKQNLLQYNSSYVVFDTDDTLLKETGKSLQENGYKLKVINFNNLKHSNTYNPFSYFETDIDVVSIVNTIISATALRFNEDPFYVKAESALLEAVIFYLKDNPDIPKDYKNFTNVMKLLQAADVNEDDTCAQSPLDKLFAKVEAENPKSKAVKQYKNFKTASGKLLLKVIASCQMRLLLFNIPEIEYSTITDELEMNLIRYQKTAIFIILPNCNGDYDFIATIFYKQLVDFIRYHQKEDISDKFHLMYQDEILASIPKDNVLLEKKDLLIKQLLRAPIKKQLNNYILKTKWFYKDFTSIEEVESFKEKLNTSSWKDGCYVSPYNVRVVLNNCMETAIFQNINAHLSYMPLYGLHYLIATNGLSPLKKLSSDNIETFIDKFDSVVLSSRDVGTLSYIHKLVRNIDISFFNQSMCMLFIKGSEPMIDELYVAANDMNNEFDYKREIVNYNFPEENIFEDIGISQYVSKAKSLDEVFKDANVKTVRDAVNRVVLAKGNIQIDVDEENNDEFLYKIE